MVSPGKLIYYNGNAAYYSHRSRLLGLGSALPRPGLVLPPARQVDSDSPRCDGETPKDRTACSVCRFVRNTQKRCTITAGRLTLLGPVPLPQLPFPSPLLLVYLARFPFHAHENLQRPRVKVELTKPVLVRQQQQQQRGRGRCRGNNNVETKESIYSTWVL